MRAIDVSNHVYKRSGLTVRQVGKLAGRSENGFSPYIYRQNEPSVHLLALLCDVCGFDLLVRQRDTGEETIIDP